MVVVNIQDLHGRMAMRAAERIITEREKDGVSPSVEGDQSPLLLSRPGAAELLIRFTVAGI